MSAIDIQTYITLSTRPVVGQVECGGGVIVDYDAEGKAVGIENYAGPVDVAALGRVIRAAHFGRPDVRSGETESNRTTDAPQGDPR